MEAAELRDPLAARAGTIVGVDRPAHEPTLHGVIVDPALEVEAVEEPPKKSRLLAGVIAGATLATGLVLAVVLPSPSSTAAAVPVAPAPTLEPAFEAELAAGYREGIQRYARGDAAGATSALRAVIDRDPSHSPSWRVLGLAYEKEGDRVHAREAFRRYLELAPGAADVDAIRRRMEGLGS